MMVVLRGLNPSLWVATSGETSYPRLSDPVDVDVAVIGAGITGLTTAWLLKQAGATVAVVEADRVAAGVTGYTTGKLTALHGLIYSRLLAHFDQQTAWLYASANQAAIAQVATLVDQLGIDCDFQHQSAFTYTEDPRGVEAIRAEADAAVRAGLPAHFTTDTELPFPVQAAVRLDNQAQFHARRYCLALAEAIAGGGCHVLEKTRALDVEQGQRCRVITPRGPIRAGHVVLATLIPFLDRGGFFAKTHAERSYLLALRLAGPAPAGMYLSAPGPAHTMRPAPEGFYLVGGQGHKVGQDPNTEDRYRALERWSRERFAVRSVAYRWSAQDYLSADGVPYIGRLPTASDRLLVATGFGKWGLSGGTAAGMILSDRVQGRKNPWAAAFDATRLSPRQSAQTLLTENLNVVQHFVVDRLKSVLGSPLESLAPGQGGIVQFEGRHVAAYRDDHGVVHAVSPVCSHMGCYVSWNTAEKTWDCPCHGSRFDCEGRVLQGPAVQDLQHQDVQPYVRDS